MTRRTFTDEEKLLIRYNSAVEYASIRHSGQRRKDGITPYIFHPLAVSRILRQEALIRDDVVTTAAVLHDTVEDTDATYEDLVWRFGQEVADVVMEVTKDPSLTKAQQKAAEIEHAARMSPRACQLKAADKIANVRDISAAAPVDWSLELKVRYVKHAREVVANLQHKHEGLIRLFNATYRQTLALLEPAEVL